MKAAFRMIWVPEVEEYNKKIDKAEEVI